MLNFPNFPLNFKNLQCQKNTHFCSIICANFWVENIWANFCEIICKNFRVWKKLWQFFRKYLRKFLGKQEIVQIFAQLFAKKFGLTNLCTNIFANICANFWKKIFVQLFGEKFAKKLAQIFYGSYLRLGRYWNGLMRDEQNVWVDGVDGWVIPLRLLWLLEHLRC